MVYGRKIGNKGMSLVELIIVVSIITVFGGVISYSLNWASGKAAEECAKKLAYNLMQARTMAMGKNTVTIEVKKDSEGYTITEMIVVPSKEDGTADASTTTTSKVGNKTVKVLFGSDGSEGSDLGGVTFEFDRASGALKKLNGAEAGATSPLFTISKGSTKRTVSIVPITGKISVGK